MAPILAALGLETAPIELHREPSKMTASPIPIDANVLLTEVAAARILKLSIRTLQAWRCRGIGPDFIRVGRAIRYRHSALIDWLDHNTVSPASAAVSSPKSSRCESQR